MVDTSVSEAGQEQPRARIRDAAMRQFAAHGFKGATVRGIAQEAEVSLGMVQRQFPSKQALREECDAHGFALLRGIHERVQSGEDLTGDAFLADVQQAVAVLGPYAAMAMISDGPSASWWFDELVELYRWVLPSGPLGHALSAGEDVEAIVTVFTAMELGIAILGSHVNRRLDATGPDDSSVMARVGRARMFLASRPLVDEDTAGRIRDVLEKYEGGGIGDD